MQHTRWNEPAGATLQPVGTRQILYAVIATVPVFQTLSHVGARRTGSEAHKRVGEIIVAVVVLRREVIALRLTFLTNQLGILKGLMHVVGNRPHVVKKL